VTLPHSSMLAATNNQTVTVVTVCRNARAHLQRTIASVQQLTLAPFEYIVIDGDSSDGTRDLLHRSFPTVTRWLSEPDDGVYAAMNKGLALANGDWCLFMNAGDTFAGPEVLSQIAPFLDKSAAVIFGDHIAVHGDGRKTFHSALPIVTIYQHMPFCHQACLVRVADLREFGLNENYRYAADWELFIRMFNSGREFLHVPVTVCEYLRGGLSESGIRPYIEGLKILFEYVDDPELLRNNRYLLGLSRNYHAVLCKHLGRRCIVSKFLRVMDRLLTYIAVRG
jgi:glycosyltransferase involved in cell wall biosynthesis